MQLRGPQRQFPFLLQMKKQGDAVKKKETNPKTIIYFFLHGDTLNHKMKYEVWFCSDHC